MGAQQTKELKRVTQAIVALNEAQEYLRRAVWAARSQGASWAEVGEALGGVTKQAAQQRFADVDEGSERPSAR
jgi:hypothetical protein